MTRRLQRLAGLFDQEAEARQMLRQLRRHHGLASRQLSLLGPADASPRRFAQSAAAWTPRWSWPVRHQGGIAPLAAVLALVRTRSRRWCAVAPPMPRR